MAKFPMGRRFTIDEIAERKKAPKTFLRKIFQKLAHKKILGSSRGIGGGFYLLRLPSKISIIEILKIMQGPVSLNRCLVSINKCDFSKTCRVRKRLKDIQKKLITLFDETTLLDLAG